MARTITAAIFLDDCGALDPSMHVDQGSDPISERLTDLCASSCLNMLDGHL